VIAPGVGVGFRAKSRSCNTCLDRVVCGWACAAHPPTASSRALPRNTFPFKNWTVSEDGRGGRVQLSPTAQRRTHTLKNRG